MGYQPATGPGAGSPGISAVLDVLDVLDRNGPTTLAQLSRETGTAKSTLHRVCSMMGERGWIARDAVSGCLELGPRVASLARAAPITSHSGKQKIGERLEDRLQQRFFGAVAVTDHVAVEPGVDADLGRGRAFVALPGEQPNRRGDQGNGRLLDALLRPAPQPCWVARSPLASLLLWKSSMQVTWHFG